MAQAEPQSALLVNQAAERAFVEVRRQHGCAAALRFVDERIGRVEAHRLLVEQRRQQLGAVVDAQPGRLVGEQAEGGGVRFGEAEAGKTGDHFEDLGGVRFINVRPARHRSLDEAAAV